MACIVRQGEMPYEAVIGQMPDLRQMHVFGTVCYAYVEDKKKLDARGEKKLFP